MTTALNAIVLFGDDFRQEVNGTYMLLGIVPDSILVPTFPAIFAKLAVFARINLPIDYEPQRIVVQMSGPGVATVKLGDFAQEVIQQALDMARASGIPYAGLMAATLVAPFTMIEPGHLIVEMVIGDHSTVVGNLLFSEIVPIPLQDPQQLLGVAGMKIIL